MLCYCLGAYINETNTFKKAFFKQIPMPRMATVPKEAFKTYHAVFDQFVEKILWGLMQKKVIDGLISPVSMGKEANIFTAKSGNKTVIVKIYRLSTCNFDRMYSFIRTDPRFPEINRQRRKVVFAWAQREFRNLLKARESGVRVPIPFMNKYNVLVMEMVGDEIPSPKAKDVMPKDPKAFINDIILQMRKLYKAGLVHGDLSPFNILNKNDQPVIIDMSQSTTLEDPNAQEYFTRDIKNVAAYANRIGVSLTVEQLMKKVKA